MSVFYALFHPNDLRPTFKANVGYVPVKISIGHQSAYPCGASVLLTLEFADGSLCEICVPPETAEAMGKRFEAGGATMATADAESDILGVGVMQPDPAEWKIDLMNE